MVCAITLLGFVMFSTGKWGPFSPEKAYNTTKDKIQGAVQDYQDNNGEGLPTINGTVTVNGSLCRIIDICALIAEDDRMLRDVPENCVSINGSDNDNCNAGCEGCWEYSHYIWVVDDAGKVNSTCVGSDCSAYNTDGYQDVWP
jgi:hypothetical protein